MAEKGIDREQARVIVRGIAEAQANLATKDDLANLEARLEAKIDRSVLTTVLWLGGIVFAASGAIIAVLLKVARFV
jgi:hypothetical protein